MSTATLLLNSDFTVINVISLRKAIKMLVKGKAAIVEADENRPEIYRGIKFPSIIRLVEWVKIPWKTAKISRVNILRRDNWECQYCGCHLTKHGATIDHITPKSRGGKTVWNNLAACCRDCNEEKDDRTPEEANMVLRHKPNTPTWIDLIVADVINDNWKRYLWFHRKS